MISQNGLKKVNNDELYIQTIKTLTPFLSEKRSKMHEKCGFVLCSVIKDIQKDNKLKVKQYL